MINVKKIKNVIMIVLILTIVILSNGSTLAYLIDKTSPLISRFIPGDYSSNDLVISKSIEHSLGDGYVVPDNMEFEFQIDLGSYYANQLIITSQGKFKVNEKGIFNIKIKPSVDVVISGIEEGTKVKVTEIIDKPGFSAKDELVKEVTISSTESSKIKFINVYKPLLVNGENITLNGKKVLDGREWQDGDNFTFKLEYYDEDKWVVLGEKTIEYSSDNIDFNKYNFNEIINDFEFKNIGLYKFRLSEVLGNLENVDYDKTINNFEIIIADETMDGKLEIDDVKVYQNITVSKKDNIFNLDVIFNNKYVPEEDKELEYVDKIEDSMLVDENIVVKDTDYTIDTVISKFDGLSDNYSYVVYDKDGNEYKEDLVRTGDYVIITDNGKDYRFDLVLIGDTSGDGLITPLDYIKIKNHIIGNSNLTLEPYMLAADMSGDNNITPLDYIKVKNYIIKGGN